MKKISGILALAGMFALNGVAGAAPLAVAPNPAATAGSSIVQKTHGDHRSCEDGRAGWHRHDRYGDRVPCERPHYGRPHRVPPPVYHHRPAPPRHCVKDWHCEKSGPFDLKKRCYWRDLCR